MQSDYSDSATKGSLSIAEVFHGHISIQAQEVPFVHSSKFDPVAEILNIMIKVWDLPVPKIMLVILSDSAPLKDWTNFEEQESFVKGLIKGSTSTSMWIFTSGLNTGISKVIGDVFQAEFNARLSEACCGPSVMKSKVSKFPLIGICQENSLTYAEKFRVLAKHVKLQNTGNNLEEQKFNLNPYHSHFLIIRDKIIDIEHTTRFLLKIEEILQGSTFFDALDEDNDLRQTVPASPIPTIAILVQGDINSIHFILAHLKRKLPVLIMRGSGGLAEILAYAYYEVHRSFQKIKDIEYVENILKKSLSDKITSVFPALKDNKVAHSSFFSRILECIKFSEPPDLKYITVFNMLDLTSNLEDLPVYLMETIFNSQKEGDSYAELRRDLQLTIDWNYPKLALAKVFYKDVRFKVENDIFEQVLLKKGREEFVSLFLDNGFELYKYLNATRVVTLFEHALREEFFRQVCWEGILGYEKMMRLDEYFIDSDLNWIVESLVGIPIYISSQELNECSMDIFKLGCSKRISCDVARRKAITVLIIWALVSNRGKLAIVLWRHVDQPIMVALASSLILDKIQTYVIEGKMKEGIIDLSQRFADMAFGVFDLCYNEMPSKAYDSLSKKTTEWAGHSIIDMAALSQNRNFVAHPCCQKWLTNKFMGNIKIRELSWGFVTFPVYIKVILCSFLVFPMYLWVRFKDTLVQEFIGADEYEESDSFHMPQETKEHRRSIPQEEAGRTHLLKYHYPPLWQMIYWMWSAPITKFWVSHMLYIVYLGIFSLAVIWTSCGNKYLDILICVWTSLIAVDSAFRIYALIQAFPNTPVFASCLEVLYMILFVIFYVALRLLNIKGFQDPYAGKILLCAGLLCFYYRMIFIYLPISSTLGPLLYRVKRMVTVDFVNFLKLVFLILIGNGIAIQAVLYPDYPLVPEMVRKSFHKAFIAFFATPVEELAKKDPNCVTWEQKPSDGIMCRVGDFVDGTCATADGFWPYLFLFQYILLLKLILITVLFALFNNTGAKLGPESNSIWKYQRYNLIVNFSLSLRLPPPLNIFSLIILIYQGIFHLYKKCYALLQWEKHQEEELSDYSGHLASSEYSYFKQLARDYYAKQEYEKQEEGYKKTELNTISKLANDVDIKDAMMCTVKNQIIQLESDIRYTHARLETLKYRAKKDDELTTSLAVHVLSRESPYPRTKIQRFPVPDKYVPWEVMWLHYEPPIYTMSKSDFPRQVRPYVDEDILSMKKNGVRRAEIPNYLWNTESVDSSGIYRNRKSWIIDNKQQEITYRLDADNLPCNPMGRTGLRGKGALPRWGPNHNIFAIITRWRKRDSKGSEHTLLGTTHHLEFVQTWYINKMDLSLPGGFVWSENKFEVIQSVFKMDEGIYAWLTAEDMVKFFKNFATSLSDEEPSPEEFKCEQIYCGYMDDILNTDQAWKEVELWHIHYNTWTNIQRKFKATTRWKVLSEEVFVKLPYGQTILLQDVIRSLGENSP